MQVSENKKGDMLIFSVEGDIDINSSPQIRSAFDKPVSEKAMKVIVNLEKVSYIDSSGLATLVEMLKKTRGYGGKIRLSGLSAKVKSLFEITKLEKLFDIYDSAEEASKDFN